MEIPQGAKTEKQEDEGNHLVTDGTSSLDSYMREKCKVLSVSAFTTSGRTCILHIFSETQNMIGKEWRESICDDSSTQWHMDGD